MPVYEQPISVTLGCSHSNSPVNLWSYRSQSSLPMFCASTHWGYTDVERAGSPHTREINSRCMLTEYGVLNQTTSQQSWLKNAQLVFQYKNWPLFYCYNQVLIHFPVVPLFHKELNTSKYTKVTLEEIAIPFL